MHPMMVINIAISAHSVLASIALTQSSRSNSLETDVSLADILSLPLSMGSARKVNVEADMEVSMVASTDTPTEVPTEILDGDPVKAPMDVDKT